MAVLVRPMSLEDYAAVQDVWSSSAGVGLSEADSREGIAAFLVRNPGLSFVATENQRVVGAVLCGHDGRRGYIHHLAVASAYRRQGIAHLLVKRCLAALSETGIGKCHLFVFRENRDALTFWQETGWTERTDLYVFSHGIPPASGST